MPRRSTIKAALLVFGLGWLLLLTGCSRQVKLYSQLEEDQANLMMALLVRMDIPCEKVAAAEGTYDLMVDDENFPAAVNILNYFGYPMKESKMVADMMKSQGIISSPASEANRQTLALADDLAKTISHINGVLAAQVFIVHGTTGDPGSSNASSASVFIKYREGFPIDKDIPKIKDLVLNSVLGLELSNIAVVTFPSREWEYTDSAGIIGFQRERPGFDVQAWAWPIALLGLGALSIGAVVGRRYLGHPPEPAKKA